MSYSPGTKAIEARRKRVKRWERILRRNEGEELGYLIAHHAHAMGATEQLLESYTGMLERDRVLRIIVLDEENHREVEFMDAARPKSVDDRRRQVPATEGAQAAYVVDEADDKSPQQRSDTAVV